jgi:hypothetical protein
MSDLRDFTGKNSRFTGTDAIRLPRGSTDQRVSPETGEIRYNESGNVLEYYNGSDWAIPLATVPEIYSISPTNINEFYPEDSSTTTTFTVTGNNFLTGVNFYFRDSSGDKFYPFQVTRNSSTSLSVSIENGAFGNRASFEPFDAVVVSPSQYGTLEGNLLDAITINSSPIWITSSGSLGTVLDSERVTKTFTLQANDPESGVIAFSLESGTLPAGCSLNSSTGVLSGFSAVGSPTTSNFTIRAIDTSSNRADRAFSITVSNIG